MGTRLELAVTEQRFRALFENLQEGIVTSDGSGMVLDWNPAALALHGYANLEEAQKRIGEYADTFELLTLDNELVLFENWPMPRVLRGETFSAWELRIRRKDSDLVKVFSYGGTPILEDGKVSLAVVTLKDVTARVAAEEALRQSETELRDFVENATIGLHWVGPDGTILWANQSELKMLGYSSDEYIGRNIADFHADAPVIGEILNSLSSGHTINNCEARLRCKDGTIRHVLIDSNVRFEGDRFIHTRCFTRDISERKQAEDALRESGARFAALADNIDQLAWMADREGWIYWYNRRWYEYTGTSAEDMEGWGWQAVHDPALLSGVLDRWKASITSGQPFDMEFPLKGADGVFRPFLTRVHPVADEAGAVVGWFGTNTDISEQKRVQDELREMSENLDLLVRERTLEVQEANEQLLGFTYSVAHDFRQQIRGMSVNAAMVLRDAGEQLDAENKKNLEMLVAAAKKMSTLTEDLLRYARLGKGHLRIVDVDLSVIAEEVIRDLVEKSYCKPSLKFQVQPNLRAQGDPGLLQLALENLLDNACKYSMNADPPIVEVGEDERGFFVRDNGTGFDMQYAGKLFQPFERLNHSETFDGTGIGLANVKRIIDRHGGQVWAESEPEKGATFGFTLGEHRSH